MLDIKFIRENADLVKKGINDKQLQNTVDLDQLLELDKKYLDLLRTVETERALRNQLSNAISKATTEDRSRIIAEATEVKNQLEAKEELLKSLKVQIDTILLWVPNPPAGDVPYGIDDTQNIVVRKVGEPKSFSFTPRDHQDLGVSLDILDVERGTKLAGFRGYFLKKQGALLEQAILRFALDFMQEQGFDFYTVPHMVKPDYFLGTGYFPWGVEDHYKTQDGSGLIGTAEVSLTSYYANEVLEEKDLPIKMVGLSPCYRREVGSYGKDTKGVFRVHQFNKVEQVLLVPEGEEISREWHEKMLDFTSKVHEKLGLPHHILLMCTGDMGPGQRKKYDLETWFASQGAYRETASDSYFLDFQARRLNIKYRTKTGELKYVNTLNNTVAATPRLWGAIIEYYQQEDGSIKVPEVLVPYMNGLEVIN